MLETKQKKQKTQNNFTKTTYYVNHFRGFFFYSKYGPEFFY